MEVQIQNIHLNMNKSHTKFRAGTIMTIAGSLITILGISSYNSAVKNAEPGETPTPAAAYVGVVITAVGTFLHIDSHKYLGRGYNKNKVYVVPLRK